MALTDDEHVHFRRAREWFTSLGREEWGLCALTEAGFVRLTTNPATGPVLNSCKEACDFLESLAALPGYRFWPITDRWGILTAPIASRIFGHQQVTDAYLLGMAIKENGVLVTFNRGIKFLAGDEFSRNLLVLE
jgi:toxin-antitoxin system PIN domain toxin